MLDPITLLTVLIFFFVVASLSLSIAGYVSSRKSDKKLEKLMEMLIEEFEKED